MWKRRLPAIATYNDLKATLVKHISQPPICKFLRPKIILESRFPFFTYFFQSIFLLDHKGKTYIFKETLPSSSWCILQAGGEWVWVELLAGGARVSNAVHIHCLGTVGQCQNWIESLSTFESRCLSLSWGDVPLSLGRTDHTSAGSRFTSVRPWQRWVRDTVC